MGFLYISFLILLVSFVQIFFYRNRARFFIGFVASLSSSLFLLSFSFSDSGMNLGWIESFQLTLQAKTTGFDLVSQFFMALLFPFLHFFLFRANKKGGFHLFALTLSQTLYQISSVCGNAFIDFQCLMASHVLIFLFVQEHLVEVGPDLNRWLRRSFLGLCLLFFSLLLVYFYRTTSDVSSYFLFPWKGNQEIEFALFSSRYSIQIRDLSFFLLLGGVVLLSGFLDFRGGRSKIAQDVPARTGALLGVLFYVFPTLFFLRLSLGIFAESVMRFSGELLWINFVLFFFAVLRVGHQKNMKAKLIHFPGIFCTLVFLVIPTLNSGVILGSVFFLFSTLYLSVVTLVGYEGEAVGWEKSKFLQKFLHALCLASALFFPLSISFYGLLEIFLGVKEQSSWLLPVVAVLFFFPWLSLIHYFSRRSTFLHLRSLEAIVAIVFLAPLVLFGSLPRSLLEPLIRFCEEYVKGVI